MSKYDAEFQVGDWNKSHRISKIESVDGHPDLGAVRCSCGWSVMTEAKLAGKLGRIHLDRAKHKERSR